jgi:hypothetical protein
MTLAIELLLALLLAATIGFCFVLDRRLAGLRAARADLERLSAEFVAAIAEARAGVGELKGAAKEAAETLQERLGKARALADELAFMTETGDRLAERLSGQISGGLRRGAGDADNVTAFKPASRGPAPRSEAERELLHALRRAN